MLATFKIIYRSYTLLITALLIFLNIFLAHKSSKMPQCCDALIYQSDAKALFSNGYFYELHNYLYPLLLRIFMIFDIQSRGTVAFAQCLLLLISGFILRKRIRVFFPKHDPVTYPVILSFLLPFSYGFSGYYLSEALTLPLLLIYVSEVIVKIYSKAKMFNNLKLIGLSTLLWMTRPAYLWLPIFTLIFILLTEKANFRDKIIGFFVYVTSILVVIFPQYLISISPGSNNKDRPFINGVLHLNLASAQSSWSNNYYRYATNLSGCGESLMFNFSPQGLTGENALNYIYEYNQIEKLKAWLLHFVSGWDALPGISYVADISYFPWIFVTLFSGVFILGPILVLSNLATKKKYSNQNDGYFLKYIVYLFMFSQLSLLNTAAEFRFNILGWILGLISWLTVLKSQKQNIRMVIFFATVITSIIIFIGLHTLNYSPIWRNCL